MQIDPDCVTIVMHEELLNDMMNIHASESGVIQQYQELKIKNIDLVESPEGYSLKIIFDLLTEELH